MTPSDNKMFLLLIIMMASIVGGVKADESRTAVIAVGCVAGGLFVAAVALGVGYFAIRHIRRKEKEKKLVSGNHSAKSKVNGFHQTDRPSSHSSSAIGLPSDSQEDPRILATKAFTQHLINPRHRPPVAFYTLRTDPRMVPELPGVIHMGHPMYARPPPVGQPVIFLGRNGPPRQRSSDDFMYDNSGTMLFYGGSGFIR